MKITKKILSFVSAGVMVMSCNSVAFADNETGILSVSNKEILDGKDSAEVIFYFESDFDSSEFVLYQNGSAVGKLVDTGNYTNDGDDIKGDGVYSLRFTVDSNTAKPTENEKVVCNTYSVQYGEEIISNEVTIDIITPFTDKELEDMSVVDDAILEFISSDEYISMDTAERIEAATKFLESLESEGLVKSIVLKDNNIFFLYSCGVQGGIMTEPFAEDMNSVVTDKAESYYNGRDVLFDDGENVLIFEDSIQLTHSRYNFTMNYVVPGSCCDVVLGPEYFGLSDDYVLEITIDEFNYIYTVSVDSMEELNKLYEASAELLEREVIQNAYKQFEYRYNETDIGEGIIKLKEADSEFDLSFVEGLEDIPLYSYSDGKFYTAVCRNLNDVILLEKAEEAIKVNENVEDFIMGYTYCTVVLPPAFLRTYLSDDVVTEPTLTEPVVTTVPATTEKTVTTSVSNTTQTYDYDYYYELRNGNNVFYENNSVVVYKDSSVAHGIYNAREFAINYVVLRDDETVTAEILGLSEDYKPERTSYDDKTETYTVKVDGMEELNKLYEDAAELLEKGVIKNAYKQYIYNYGCMEPSYFEVTFKNESDILSVAETEGLEDIKIKQDDKYPNLYKISYMNFNNYRILKDILDENPNVVECIESRITCALAHTPIMLRTYLIEDNSVDYDEIQIYTNTVIGDADKDKEVNVRDCSFIAGRLAKGNFDELPISADFNKDRSVNIRDASAIAKWLTENK